MNVSEAIKTRVSAHSFDPERTIGEDEIKELAHYATLAPSSYNVQNWRFVAVSKPEDKERLKAVAYNQAHVTQSAVMYIVLGDLQPHSHIEEINQLAVDAGNLPAAAAASLTKATIGAYENNAQASRDEAFRSGGLAAMNLMLAATEKGFVSCPMGGFQPDGVRREFNIPERYLPVMLIAVGYAAKEEKQKPRLGLDEVLRLDDGGKFPA